MIFLEFIYKIITRINNQLYEKGIIKSYKSRSFVISIGNIIAGGTGKTPVVAFLAENISKLGFRTAIVSGGYKRRSSGFLIIHDGDKLLTNVDKAGDESYLLAKKTKITTVVHDKKYLALRELNNLYDIDVVIIDDGFQHRKIERDLDIVIINQKTIDENRLIPAGYLREEKSKLERADLLLFRDLEEIPADLNKYLHFNFNSNILMGNSEFKKGVVCTSIANPQNFVNFLKSNNVTIEKVFAYKDHYFFKKSDINNIVNHCNSNQLDCVFVTEKDFVKIEKYSNLFTENNIKLQVIEMTISFEKEKEFLEYLKIKINEKLRK